MNLKNESKMNQKSKNMFQLIEDHKQAEYEAAKHYFDCGACQEYFNNIDVPECEKHIELKNRADSIKFEIEAYKIDIS